MRFKKKLVMVTWGAIAIVFVGLLGFLLFSMTGLAITVQPTESFEVFEVIVSNQSHHVINNVTVLQQNTETKKLGVFASLRPQESQRILIPVQASRIKVLARAPFHQSAEKNLFLEPPQPFATSIQVPENLVEGRAFAVSLKVCNQSPETRIQVTETHNQSFFGVEPQSQELVILRGECRETSFLFQPRFSCATMIFFNIKSNSFSEKIQQELKIGK